MFPQKYFTHASTFHIGIYYNDLTIADSLGLIVHSYDTINNTSLDTVYVKFEETKRDRAAYTINYSKPITTKENPEINQVINFSKPTQIHHQDSIYFQVDSQVYHS